MITAIRVFISSSVGSGRVVVVNGNDIVYLSVLGENGVC